MRIGHRASLVLLLVTAIRPEVAAGQWVSEKPGAGAFPLVQAGRAATLVHDPADHRVVAIAVQDLSADIKRVTGVRPVVRSAPLADFTGPTVIVGTLGRSRAIDDLVRRRQLDVRDLAGAWESFVIATVPGDGARRTAGSTLVVVGSDRRGTAFGIYELAQAIGVSPWHWWADVAPDTKRELHVAAGTRRFGPPSVKYRGIFINDEDWGLHPWAAKTFDPVRGDIGPRTYAKVFELLLRLKANTCWPAMHEVTGAFNSYPENRQLADDYAIVMGSSHAEPMLRNNVTEWTAPAAAFNYATNRDGVLAYWDQRVRENARFENIYTLGMRGIHDSPMQGPATVVDRVAALERIFADERELLARHVNAAVDRVPQVFTPYKEVLDIYRAGLRVPDDVTIVWPDDNHGYIRSFPSDEERRRAGGFGVYYHLSYLGAPLAYLWLYTTPPALVWEEMTKAHALGARTLWIANAGDIKPAEIGIELFLQLAWNIDRWPRERAGGFLVEWAAREFGAALAPDIGGAMSGYFELNHQRRPEHLQWWLTGERIRPSALTPEEIAERLARFAELGAQVDRLRALVPAAKRDAFFELVEYPVRGSALANERFFAAEEYTRLFNSDPPAARTLGARARAADAALTELTRRYNEEIAGGKWRHIMSVEPADGMWRSFRAVPPVLPSAAMVAAGPTPAERRSPQAGSTSTAGDERVIALEAEHFSRTFAVAGTSWEVVPGLGRTGDAVVAYPVTAARIPPDAPLAQRARLEYDVVLARRGALRLSVGLVPVFPVRAGAGLNLLVALDGGAPHLLSVKRDVDDPAWARGVLDQAITGVVELGNVPAGAHTLTLAMVDPGVVVDTLVLAVDGASPPGNFGPRGRH